MRIGWTVGETLIVIIGMVVVIQIIVVIKMTVVIQMTMLSEEILHFRKPFFRKGPATKH